MGGLLRRARCIVDDAERKKKRVEATLRSRAKRRSDPVEAAKLKLAEAAWREKYRTENPEQYKASFRYHNAKRKFGITKEQYDQLLITVQCPICGDPATDIDHCHVTGKIRDRLCGPCNKGLGFFRDNTHILNCAINYLEKHRVSQSA